MIRILLVEDNVADARILEENLREAALPFRLTKVESLAAAMPLAGDHDVVLLDLSLPDALGLETVSRMISATRVPIVVLTGNRDDRVALEAVAAGAQDYLLKDDVTPALAARTIRYAIERQRMHALEVERIKSAEALSRARFVAEVAAASSSSLDVGETMRAVVRLLVPTLADACAIDLVRPDGGLERVASHAVAAAHEALVANPAPCERAEAPGERARTTTPVFARGRQVAVITYGCAAGRAFGVEERLLADDVGRHVALAIDNARLFADAQRALRGRDELLAIVSHDLRNPLGVIDLALGLIARDASHLQAALPRAQRAAQRMTTLISDLLEVTRIDAGTLTVTPLPTDLLLLLTEVVEQHRVLCSDKSLQLVTRMPADLGTLKLDSERIVQALGNLLGNAIKFTPPGGTITLAAERNHASVTIQVRDTGVGMPDDQIAHIFDRFWQGQHRRKDSVGLGLAIVKGIVDAHGGRIHVESAVGAGTSFSIVLPLDVALTAVA